MVPTEWLGRHGSEGRRGVTHPEGISTVDAALVTPLLCQSSTPPEAHQVMHRSTMPEFLQAIINVDRDAVRCICCDDAVLVRQAATFVNVRDYVCTKCRALRAQESSTDTKGRIGSAVRPLLVNTDISPRNAQN